MHGKQITSWEMQPGVGCMGYSVTDDTMHAARQVLLLRCR
jgi:hypothetical protein